MVNVRFYGSLKQFGTEFRLDCKTPAEVVQALTSQIPKLRQFIQQGLFTVRVGREYLDNRHLEQGLNQHLKDDSTVHFTPVLKGSKKAGLFQTIVGAVMVVVGAFTSWAGGAALIAGGIGLMAGGVAQMLTKMPSMSTGKDAERKQSTSFSNLSNMAAQGRPMPLAYGRIRVGSLIISQGVETMDIERQPPEDKKGKMVPRFRNRS
ncbi:MAG: tail assembly protein [Haemophilus parainfluenzae]|uniref:tail assembly protein n=1 Tax=uncultured Haemophilus sp. TaxID=237779 RepID=UPI0028044431|nr:tail assembly protein [uncultured Haemophilus sp.]MDU4566326.1 tail assembly protein [Haemophilus parainfluenzae]MDU4638171.1 tail assembly protein [Haemophilus parainfluenzae]MDU5990894.1 tail assembly protein [Haemophilus parainfluenzae]